MIEYHNPEGHVAVEIEPYSLSASITDCTAISIGFLANGFPDSENFLHEIEQAMQALVPEIQVHSYNKGNASIPAGEEMLAQIKGECQAVVAAYGH